MDVGVNYSIHSGPKKVRHGSKQTYFCRRSGVKWVSAKNAPKNKRAGKSQGIYTYSCINTYTCLEDCV